MDIKLIEKNTDMKIEYHETITSTSERAKEIAEAKLRQYLSTEKVQVVVS